MSDKIMAIVSSSPALKVQSEIYPARFRGRVPLKVCVACTIVGDIPFLSNGIKCIKDNEYYVWVNSHGAVAAIMENGELLGLKPSEFDVVEWHESLRGAK